MIQPANLRDTTYVLSHLNPHDYREISAQTRYMDPLALASSLLGGEYAFQAHHRGTPCLIFGANPMTATTVSAWAMGTAHSWRAIPAVTRFILGPLQRQLYHDGYRWAEARSIEGYSVVHQWLEKLGGTAVGDLPGFGVDGEDFVLFRGPINV